VTGNPASTETLIDEEVAMLLAVAAKLRDSVANGGLGIGEQDCNVEIDEFFRATSGRMYVAVRPGGYSPGESHSGGSDDLVVSLSVTVAIRVTEIARDRQNRKLTTLLGNLGNAMARVRTAVSWNYGVMNAANALIDPQPEPTKIFREPLRFTGIDTQPRMVSGASWGDVPSENNSAMARTMFFSGARFISKRNIT
jgi:hypothetical protein